MAYKPRSQPDELLLLSSLNRRGDLTPKEKQHYLNLSKGFKGEVTFDELTKQLQCDCCILNDLLLQANNTLFQIDTLIITSKKIHMFEVKNYEGEYGLHADKFYKLPHYEIVNPLHQLGRSKSLLRQIFHEYAFNLPIEASVIFINPEFTLYQATPDKPFILPTQLKSFMRKLNATNSKLSNTHRHIAEKLNALHIKKSPHKLLKSYHYADLQKGITCLKCHSLSTVIEGQKLVCRKCNHKEAVANAIMRSVEEFKRLFPKHKITTSVIQDWCQVVNSKKRIRKVLDQHFTKIGTNRWIYYE
ncbi:MAG TPA: nuclease-related domain-containing protein [Lentibacillus sp.]|uniref:nuclease-related domain-containing protein n=1 Tax=Lentibacillus sp. TaxID=1925746 RepID=UPI002B4AFCBB|nr:nuclease-related domain-containing protein [Lentibacillus sp.]HLR63506.1 nuclease-related domain-containing protein [Lentibacillus sp.]